MSSLSKQFTATLQERPIKAEVRKAISKPVGDRVTGRLEWRLD